MSQVLYQAQNSIESLLPEMSWVTAHLINLLQMSVSQGCTSQHSITSNMGTGHPRCTTFKHHSISEQMVTLIGVIMTKINQRFFENSAIFSRSTNFPFKARLQLLGFLQGIGHDISALLYHFKINIFWRLVLYIHESFLEKILHTTQHIKIYAHFRYRIIRNYFSLLTVIGDKISFATLLFLLKFSNSSDFSLITFIC